MDTLTLRLVYSLIYWSLIYWSLIYWSLIYWSLFSLNLFLFPTYLFLFLSIYFPSISFSFSCYYIYYPLPTDLSQGLPQWFYFFIFSYLTGRANIQTGPKEKQHVSSPYYDSLSPTAQVVGRACIVLDWKTLSKMEVYIYIYLSALLRWYVETIVLYRRSTARWYGWENFSCRIFTVPPTCRSTEIRFGIY